MPSIGQKVRVKRNQGDVESAWSRLVDADEAYLYIDVPVEGGSGRPLSAQQSDSLWIEFTCNGGLYGFPVEMRECVEIPAPAWRLSRPAEEQVIRLQRREFVRVKAVLPVELQVAGRPPVQAYSRDISGGGLALVSSARQLEVNPGDEVQVSFRLPGDFLVTARCVVARVTRQDAEPARPSQISGPEAHSALHAAAKAAPHPADDGHGDTGAVVLSLRFLDLQEKVRQRIIQFIFQRQRMHIR